MKPHPQAEPYTVAYKRLPPEKHRVQREKQLDLEFVGWLVASSTVNAGARDFTTNIYETRGGAFVVSTFVIYRDSNHVTADATIFHSAQEMFAHVTGDDGKRYVGSTKQAWLKAVDAMNLPTAMAAETLA